MAASRDDLLRYAMDVGLSYSVHERLEKAGWKHHPEQEGAQCPCREGTYAHPDRYWRTHRKLRCTACKRVVYAAEPDAQTEGS